MTPEITLTGTEIARLTAIAAGDVGYRRAATKDKAAERFNAALKTRVGEALAMTCAVDVLGAPDFATAEGYLRTAMDKADPAPAAAPAARKPAKAKAKTAAPAKPAARPDGDVGPRPGSKSRIMYDMMRRPQGATQAEIVEAGGINESLADVVVRFAGQYGHVADKAKDGRRTRYFLRDA